MPAIGLSGFAGTGKTTAAKYIEAEYGFERRHIAEPIRAMLAVLLKANGMHDAEITDFLEGSRKEQVIPCLGVTSRYAQITLGTEWGRDLIKSSLWSDTWSSTVENDDYIMNDSVRFLNEEEVIQEDLGGFTIMIVRPDTHPAKFQGGKIMSRVNRWLYDRFGYMGGVHGSERIDLLSPDYVIVNDGSVEDLFDRIDEVMSDQGHHRDETEIPAEQVLVTA
jgi:hypothetical protein